MSLSTHLSTKNRGLSGISRRLKAVWASPWGVPLVAGVIASLIFLITLQTHINGSNHAYATDVGELQNALPRWGTIHFSGYPLYSITGSLIVTLLRIVGIQPAMGSSLVSLLWGVLTVSILARLALDLGASRPGALAGALILPVSTSMWIDSSLAEVHTMTLLFMVLMIWLAVVLGQGVFHGRSVIGLLPAVALLIIPRWRSIWRNVPVLVVVGLVLPPLLYLYLPLREWMGSDWTFGNTSTWEGFWRMFLNIKAARFVDFAREATGWLDRLAITRQILNDDLPLVLHAIGAIGLFAQKIPDSKRLRYGAALLLALLPFVVVPMIVYAGFVGDALLALKVPVSLFTGLGIALLISRLQEWRPAAGTLALALVASAVITSGWRNYPDVVAITRDRGAEEAIAIADQATNPERPTVMMIQWGHHYWGAAYAQAYRGQLEKVTLVDHNAPFAQLVTEGNTLLTLSETFYRRPITWWESKLGPVALETYAPGLVEIRTEPRIFQPGAERFQVNDELSVASVEVDRVGDTYQVKLQWVAEMSPSRDYSTAVHLVSADPPASAEDIIAQDDSLHPVAGWYPTTRWVSGQQVQDVFSLAASPDKPAVAIRITAYTIDENGAFVNGEWLSVHPEE